MTPQNSNESVSLPIDPQKPYHLDNDSLFESPKTSQLDNNDQIISKTKSSSKTHRSNNDHEASLQDPSPSLENVTRAPIETKTSMAEDTGRERLKRHRVEVAGRVWIPDIWGQEDLLKDWIVCNPSGASLLNRNIMSARTALVQEGRRANSSGLRIENRC